MKASARVRSMEPYAFAAMEAARDRLQDRGIRVLDFGVADPTVPTPAFIRQALARAAGDRRASRYPSYIGSRSFREAAASWMARRFHVRVDPEREVTATLGSKEAIFNIHEGFVDPGDMVISPSPGYPPYARGARFAEGETFFYPLEEAGGFLPDLDAVPGEVARRARVFWICQPHAPTGKALPPGLLSEVTAFCREFGILLCSDEAYSEFYYGERPPDSILQHAREGALAFFSLSKRSAMAGYRCGWVAGDPEATAVFRKVKTNIDSGTPSFVQAAAAAALGDEDHVASMREGYRRKRDVLAAALVKAGFPPCLPECGLFIWQRTPEGVSGEEAAGRLLRPDIAVVAAPGAWLAETLPDGTNPGKDYIRFSLTPPEADVEEAARRLAHAGRDGLFEAR